ncbi:PPM-type phosphatase domain-containing protein [Fusarium falciforme]|uniref:PPM-type phosphatase domain-containing protein n=1 Tax=Fusarium falciforme TaxID=195108 RepID=UPI002300FF28|nr:PPM-type phosphatase domain-containing protein [Fusarium falciforme]WAO85835.1 PPM-type phosphatase domain-containing protein [Fusarium falciforme]
MFPWRVASARLTAKPILRNRFRAFSSNKASRLGSNMNITATFAAMAGAVAVPGLWWWMATNDDAPSLAGAPTANLFTEPGPSKDEVTRILSQEAYSFRVRNIPGVDRYDGTQLSSNSPCEDRFAHGKFPSPWNDGSQWMALGVFDGHAGWQTADLLEKQLIPHVQQTLSQLKPASTGEPIPDEDVQRAIAAAFVNLDNLIIKTALDTAESTEPLQDKIKKQAVAYAGSCALLSLYDPSTNNLYTACTGDSRAVLGRRGADGKWEAIPLSVDQTGDNKEEVARLAKEHPGEENIVKDGRVLGMMVSRAFGDGRWKWPLEFQQDAVKRFYGIPPLTPKHDFKTPPYLTAEPVVTTTKIDPNKSSFLIMATDGLWYTLKNQQAVDIVGKWVDSRTAGDTKNEPEPTYAPFEFGHFWKGVTYRFAGERLTTEDNNAAVSLLRNSLGGNHHELVAGRLAFAAPFARRLRDDTTVQVAFFNCKA